MLKSFLLGVLSYLPYHFVIGVLAHFKIPAFASELMRTYKRPAIIAVDLVITALPLLILFLVLAFIVFRWVIKPHISTTVCFITGWAIVTFSLLAFGHFRLGVAAFAEVPTWPHVLVTQFAPAAGAAFGAWLAYLSRPNYPAAKSVA